MADEPDDAAPAQGDPNTPRELARARADAKAMREERDRYRGDLDTLRKENDGLRGKVQQTTNEFTAFKADAEKATATLRAESDQALTQARTDADRAVISAEVRAEAVKAGVHNPVDFVKLVDLSGLKRGEKGDIEGVSDLIATQRKERGYLFGNGSTASTASTPRQPDTTTPPTVRNMNADQLSSFERENGITV